METKDSWTFSVVDYVVFAGVLAISLIIGIVSSFKGNQSPEAYLLGNRSLPRVPVAMSLLCSFISAVNIIGFTSEIYSFGTQLFTMMIGCVLGIGISITITLPVLYPLKLTSVHEYMMLRYDSRNMQLLMMCLIYFNALVYMGICLYATSIALAAIAPLSYITFLLVIGFVCTLYSTIGGIRAVVWTDTFQLLVMLAGLLAINSVGIYRAGGLHRVYQISNEGGRLEFFKMDMSIYERHTFFNTISFGTFLYAAMFGISQINVQRICAVSTMTDAKVALCYNMVGTIILHCLIFLGGLVVYATYAGCDPFLNGKIEKRDEVLSYFVVNQLGDLVGVPGIFVATLVASTLSTFSSLVNAQVAILWKDLFHRFEVFREASPITATFINKILTFVTGAAFIGMAIVTANAKSIIQLALAVFGINFGCIFGVFMLGMCFPRSTIKGAWCGIITSIVFLLWVHVGKMTYGTPQAALPFSTELCKNETMRNDTSVYYSQSGVEGDDSILVSFVNQTLVGGAAPDAQDESSLTSFGLLYIYDISYTLYSLIAPGLCILVGIIVSYITGPANVEDLSPELITPIVRKFYKMEGKLPKEDLELTAEKQKQMRS